MHECVGASQGYHGVVGGLGLGLGLAVGWLVGSWRGGKYAVIGNGYFPHRWGILLFTSPPGSRARRLGWSQYMHECVGASQGYHGVVGGLGLGLGLAVGWLVGSWRGG